MSKFIDLTGQRFGRLIVKERVNNDKGGNTCWLCECDCGKGKKIQGVSLKFGLTQSCGCLQKERVRDANLKHGHAKANMYSKIYRIWGSIIQRCNNPNNSDYKYYGGRGIKVCKRWDKFENFLKDMGEKPEGLSIDRKDNDGNYEPSNVRFVTIQENLKNKGGKHSKKGDK